MKIIFDKNMDRKVRKQLILYFITQIPNNYKRFLKFVKCWFILSMFYKNDCRERADVKLKTNCNPLVQEI